MNDLLKQDDAQQNVDVAALGRDMVVHRMAGPPDIDIVITLEPTDAQPVPRPRLRALPDGTELIAGSTWPMTYRGKAGIYALDVDVEPPLTRCVASSPFMAEPPRSVQRAKVN